MTGAELKASILQAAVQGKLVPQDPNDEPASKLLERIREERRELVKQKKAKAPRGGESIITRYSDGTVWERRGKGNPIEITDEVPFDIPDGWEWARLEPLGRLETGKTPPTSHPEYFGEDVSFVTPGDISYESSVTYDVRMLSFLGCEYSRTVGAGSILQVCIGGSAGKVCMVDRPVAFNQQINAIECCSSINPSYVFIAMRAGVIQNKIEELKAGTATPIVNKGTWGKFLVPVPPLAEQRRIVAKLDELMPMVERYDKLDRERTELNAGIEGAMRASILQAAVQGQLTEREDGDEPASKLLEHIREERRELVKQKKAKAPRGGESVITRYPDGTVWEQRGKGAAVEITDEVPFDIPEGWEWARLETLTAAVETPFADGPFGSNLKKAHYVNRHEVRIIQLSNIGEDGWRNENEKYTSFEHLKTISRSEVQPGDIVIAKMMPAGRAIEVPDLGTKYVLSSDGVKFVPSPALCKRFLLYAINSRMFREQVSANAQGMTRIRTSVTKLRAYYLPVPPFAEQQRIVAKLDEMLPKTEKLGKLVS